MIQNHDMHNKNKMYLSCFQYSKTMVSSSSNCTKITDFAAQICFRYILSNLGILFIEWQLFPNHENHLIQLSADKLALREVSSQTNVSLQYKLLASIVSAVCSVIQQS